MPALRLPDDLVEREAQGKKIVFFILDGLGGLPHPDTGLTELETAATPAMDALAARSSLGAMIPVSPGIAPGSGPGHLSLFGYDPLRYLIGRGALSALGVGFDLKAGDLAARLNLATLDGEGRIKDRRAGRPADEEGRRVVDKARAGLVAPEGIEVFLEHEKKHRAVLILWGSGAEDQVSPCILVFLSVFSCKGFLAYGWVRASPIALLFRPVRQQTGNTLLPCQSPEKQLARRGDQLDRGPAAQSPDPAGLEADSEAAAIWETLSGNGSDAPIPDRGVRSLEAARGLPLSWSDPRP